MYKLLPLSDGFPDYSYASPFAKWNITHNQSGICNANSSKQAVLIGEKCHSFSRNILMDAVLSVMLCQRRPT